MAGFARFEDIDAWQKARVAARRVYATTREGALARDFALRDQLRRAARSVMASIAEGFARGTNPQFAMFLDNARGSAAEVRSDLYLCLDLDYLSETTFDDLYGLYDEISRMIRALASHLRST